MTRAQMLNSISVGELTEWWILYQREPWGETRLDVLFGYALAKLQMLIKAVFSQKGAQIKRETIHGNMLDWWGEIEKQEERQGFQDFKQQLQQIDQRMKDNG